MERGEDQQDEKGRPGVAAGAQHGGVVVVEEAEDQAGEHQLEVHRRLAADGVLRALRPQERGGKGDAAHGDEQRQHCAAQQRRGVHAAQAVALPGAEAVGAQNAHTDGAADDQGVGHVHDGGGHADAGQGQVAQKIAHHDGVHDAVKLLKDVAENDGQRKIQQGREGRAGQQRTGGAGGPEVVDDGAVGHKHFT